MWPPLNGAGWVLGAALALARTTLAGISTSEALLLALFGGLVGPVQGFVAQRHVARLGR